MVKPKVVVVALAVGMALGMLGVLAVAQAQSQRARASLTALDYAEIQQLYARYAIGFDSGNGDLFARAFTADGTFVYPVDDANHSEFRNGPGGLVIVGRQKLAEFAASGTNKGPTNVAHTVTNPLIEPSAEG